ncbi:PREDICTED: uncharacterized protein LOC104604186 [Nelumbo nucifera]|uniref:Uncharacterized protein n=2 Tax=Nelumbo nucifera TaxID=4432 RepID=A0A822ZC20_NELNU|nr:PREDICTED: uncharacterized protein LOC104604186 [Nelumbo nucifera]DAD41019.1 TPA_asm: hypothetical protein HUJ06_015342 [Nelumbo nucifera]
MSMRRPIPSYNLRSFLRLITRYRSQIGAFSSDHLPDISTRNHLHGAPINHGLKFLSVSHSRLHTSPDTKMVVKDNVDDVKPPVPPPSSRTSFSSWAKWVLGSILSLFLPFWKHKWENLLRLEDEVEMVAERVENVARAVEKVASVAEKVSAEVADIIPHDGKLKEAALLVERVSKETAKDAQLAQDIVHQADELKQELDTIIEPFVHKGGAKGVDEDGGHISS